MAQADKVSACITASDLNIHIQYLRFEVHMGCSIKIVVSWDMMPCSLLGR